VANVDVELVVVGESPDDDMRSLRRWLLAEPELRGLVSLREASPAPGELGPRLDAVVVSLRATAARSARVLEQAMAGWLEARPPTRSGHHVVVWVRTPEYEFKLSTDLAGLADPLVRRHFDVLTQLAERPPVPDTSDERHDGVEGGGAGEGLTQPEIEALASVFASPADVARLLRRAGLPPERFPMFGAGVPAEGFWAEVGHQLGLGLSQGGRRRLLAAARAEYPGNPVFRQGAGA
jgi:hypothetical protein